MDDKYAIPLDALERSAHVPPEEQIEEHPEPPPPDAIDEGRVEAQRIARIAGF